MAVQMKLGKVVGFKVLGFRAFKCAPQGFATATADEYVLTSRVMI